MNAGERDASKLRQLMQEFEQMRGGDLGLADRLGDLDEGDDID